VAFILPYSSKHSRFVCHFGEIPKGVTSHVHYYSTHQLLTLSLLPVVQFKFDAFRVTVSEWILVILPGVLALSL
jgi:hypothetical protein